MIDEEKILEVAEQAVKMAGSFIRLMSMDSLRIFMGDEVTTTFDLESERQIKNVISMNFPDHVILAEESTFDEEIPKDADVVWFVDPLDGTKAFIKGNVAFVTLSVAARDKEGLVATALLNPFTTMLYSARRGHQAMLNGVPLSRPMGIPLKRARMLIDYSGRLPKALKNELATADLSGNVGRVFKYDGSIAQHLALIAQGTLDGGIFWGTGTKGHFWDIAGALLILDSLGIKTTDLDGEPITAHSKVFDQMVIAAEPLHKEILDYVSNLKTLAEQ